MVKKNLEIFGGEKIRNFWWSKNLEIFGGEIFGVEKNLENSGGEKHFKFSGVKKNSFLNST